MKSHTNPDLQPGAIARRFRYWLPALLAIGLAIRVSAADALSKSGPAFELVVTCFNGKIDSGTSCSSRAHAVSRQGDESVSPGMTCGTAGRVSRLSWEYLGSKDGSDYYRVIRRFPADARDATTTAKTVKFSGKRVIVFEDEFQVIVLDPATR